MSLFKKHKGIFLFAIGLLSLVSVSAQAQPLNALFHQANDPMAGNPKGVVTVVEFFDYQCSHCIDMAPVISTMISSNPTVRVIFKEFPIRGAISEFAARAALAANLQGKYMDLHQAMLTTTQPLTDKVVLQLANDAGLNVDQLKKDMDSSVVKKQLASNMKLGESLGLKGTPTFFIGKSDAKFTMDVDAVVGAMSQSELQAAINKFKKS